MIIDGMNLKGKIMGLKVGTVKIEKYNLNWKKMFDDEKERLETIFGDIAIEIEHVGSTSIEGLSAKPIIDIAVGLNSLADFEKVKYYFENELYSIKSDSVKDEILVRKGREENRTHFIHIMELNSQRYKDTIIFRDYLKKHKDVLKKYEELKKDLAIKYANNREMYSASKNDFIKEVIKKAYKENL